MKNIVLIIAGGVGARMGQDIPKQFINVYDKPVIVYTLEACMPMNIAVVDLRFSLWDVHKKKSLSVLKAK